MINDPYTNKYVYQYIFIYRLIYGSSNNIPNILDFFSKKRKIYIIVFYLAVK